MKSEYWSVVLRSIVSFGAPVSNEYKLIVEGQAPISIHTSQVSFSKFSFNNIAIIMCRYLSVICIMYL